MHSDKGRAKGVSNQDANDKRVFLELRDWIASISGLEPNALWADGSPGDDDGPVVNYKPLQSLFNKAYVRRGQMQAAQIAGDIRRATLTVQTSEEMATVVAALERSFPANFERKVDRFKGNSADQLQAISEMDFLQLPCGQRVAVYRVKANSSQAGLEAPQLYNINFFIGHPTYYQTGLSAAYICACEVQLGVHAIVTGLRTGHVAYETGRILDALPILKGYHAGMCAAGVAPDVDYEAIRKGLFRRAFPRVDRDRPEFLEHRLPSAVSYDPARGQLPPLATVINDVNFDYWSRHQHSVLWEHACDRDAVQNVESLFVDITDQGWGNEGLIIALAMLMGPYVVILSSRGFNSQERHQYTQHNGIWLIADDGYNFSGFTDKTIVPKGVSKIMLLAVGRLDGSGHAMRYGGHRIRIATMLPRDQDV